MRLLLQRVTNARVSVSEDTVGAIGKGVVAFLGVARTDTAKDADYLLDKLLGLRIFPDPEGKMNRNVAESGGELLLVSQFTLYADCRRGRRPSFDLAAPPDQAKELYTYFLEAARKRHPRVEAGVFQASMQVELINDGPVTILLESDPTVR